MEVDELKLERPRSQRGAPPGIKTHDEQGKLCDEMCVPYRWSVVFRTELLTHRRARKPLLRSRLSGVGGPAQECHGGKGWSREAAGPPWPQEPSMRFSDSHPAPSPPRSPAGSTQGCHSCFGRVNGATRRLLLLVPQSEAPAALMWLVLSCDV